MTLCVDKKSKEIIINLDIICIDTLTCYFKVHTDRQVGS